jgi:RHS repeat-associated protein
MFLKQYFDKETKTHYNINRNYNPITGRYIQSDPIGFDGGVNTYLYANGNPVGLVDPEGLFGWDDIVNSVSNNTVSYGTSDCEYYKKRCIETGGKDSYYCSTAQKMCNLFPKKEGSWSNCVRKCLQDYDHKYCKPACEGYGYNDTLCTFNAHAFCFIKCAENKKKDPIR